MELLEIKQIKIGDKTYPIKMTVRSMISFEKMAGKPVDDISTLEDITIYFYCTFKAGGNSQTYDEFMDLIDDKPESITAFADAMTVKAEKKQKTR